MSYLEKLFRNFPNFSLSKFIIDYNTRHIKKPRFTPHSQPKNKYPKNWDEISARIREESGYICSECLGDFSDNKHLLHVHHFDGFKWNVNPGNLQVLCFKCHSEVPGHSKLKYLYR